MLLVAVLALGLLGNPDGRIELGRLARAVRTANLRSEPRDDAPAVFTIEAGTLLAVREGVRWVSVVMKDGGTAYVRRDSVRLLAYQVTGPARASAPPAASDLSDEIARFAASAVGGKAVARGTALDRGIGNGEFVALAYRSAGLSLPADPETQSKVGDPVRRLEDLRPGDRLYFWGAAEDRIAQAAIYVGGGYAALADLKAGTVRLACLDEARQAILVAARR